MKYLRHLFALSLIISVLSCDDQVDLQEEIDPAFTAYVTGFTSGVISSQDVIQIKLTQSVSAYNINEAIEDDLFDFSPSIEGQAFLIDDQTIEFRPAEVLPSGTIYKVEFDLSKVMDVPEDLKTFSFAFQVIEQAIFAEFTGMKPYNDDDLTLQMVYGNVQTSDYADAEILETLFEVVQNGVKKNLSWTHSTDGRSHDFQIDSLARGEERSNLSFSWDGDDLEVEDGDLEFSIPPLGEFSVMNVNVVQHPTQRIEVHFSDPLKKDQNLSGLIYLVSQVEVRLVIESNMVYVYPQKKLAGDHEIVIEEFVVNSLGYQLISGNRSALAFTSYKPAVEILGKGVIIPNADGVILPFKAVNLTAVDFKIVKIYENNVTQFLQDNNLDGKDQLRRVGRLEKKGTISLKNDSKINYSIWNNFYLDLSDYVDAEPGAIYRVSLSFRPSQSLYTCENKVVDQVKDASVLEDPEYAEYDEPVGQWYYYDDYYYEYNSDYRWNERENPCHISYYLRGNNMTSRNVLASDLGIIAKSGSDDQLHAFVTDLKTSEPISGVEVELYNYQQQKITSGSTDGNGMATIQLDGKVPFLMIAKLNNQRGYLRLDDGTSRSVSMFNVGGKKIQRGLKGFLYGERGVWRPGDSLFLSFILEDELKAVPAGHPVIMELYTPENQLYQKRIQTRSVNGFYDFRTKTDDDAPTGNWTAKVKVGGAEFNKRIKIEAIKPNRLKINLDFGSEILQGNSSILAKMNAAWLHGAKAGNLKADVEMSLNATKTTFKDYPDFHFDDPSKEFDAEEKIVFDGSIDADGNADFYPEISVNNSAPGMLNARFVTRVFERGGDFSIDRYDIKYSPFDNYVGVKVPEGKGWNGAIFSDENTIIPIVSVDEFGRPVSKTGLKVEVFKVDWRWWWEHEDRWSLSQYVSNRSNNLILSATANTKNGSGSFQMQFDREYWGRYFIRITDPVSGHSSGQMFYMSYSRWWDDPSADNPGGAEMLTFTTDKKQYGVEEDVKVNLPEFSEGRALITIENSAEVLEKFWVDAADASDGVVFKTSPDMAPNVFVNVTLIQPHNKTTNNLPMRLYGIEKIMVVDKNTILNPVISMSKNLEPEKKVKIKVSEKDGRKMTYTLAMVDDGLLDLTRFKTPDPWSDFYTLQALGVKTWDLYPYVLGDFGMNADGLLAIGGDEALANGDKKKANRFKPVVKFIGPFELEAGEEKEHEFVMPNYIGSVRTMVVAGQDGAYGSTDFSSKVKKPVMILPTIPRVIGPGESFSVPVSVFAMDENIKEVKVEIKANDKFTVMGDKVKSIRFSEVGEEMLYFDVKAKEAIGFGKFDFKATGGSYTSNYNVEINVRPSNPVITEIYDGSMQVNSTWTTEFDPFGVSGTEKATLELTSLPPIGLEKRLKYLIRYPYGCIEQTTSSVFAQLFLNDLIDLEEDRKTEVQKNIEAGIIRISTFQTASGGLAYWKGETTISEWGTNYGGHFMIEAKERGYDLPSGYLKSWISCQKTLANSWRRGIKTKENSWMDLNQAYRLYTLAKAGSPALGAMNRMMQIKNLSKQATWRLAGAYAVIGKEKVAKKLIENIDYNLDDYRELSYSYGSRNRDLAMILEVMVELEDPVSRDLMMDLADIMNKQRWLSTHETGYMLMSIAKAAGTSGTSDKNITASISVNGKSVDVKADMPFYQMDLAVKHSNNVKVSVVNKGGKLLFARIISEGIPMAGQEEAQSKNLDMSVTFKDMQGVVIDPSRIEQGSDFMVEVRLKNPGTRADYKEMALNQIFPSGWEIRNTRMDNAEGASVNKNFRYQDVRDDRVYTFFDLSRNETKTFSILLNATYSGRFYLPAFVSGAMYDESIGANSKGRWVEVVNSSIQ